MTPLRVAVECSKMLRPARPLYKLLLCWCRPLSASLVVETLSHPMSSVVVSPTAPSYTQNTRFSNIVNGMGRLSVNDPESSSSSAKNVSRVPSQRSKSTINSSLSSTNPQNTGHGDHIGILRNASGHQLEPQSHGGSVVVQRVINSAGQPRKVLLPVVEKEGLLPQLRSRFRDFSPARRYGTPGPCVMGSASSKWDPAQSPYT